MTLSAKALFNKTKTLFEVLGVLKKWERKNQNISTV